MEKNTVQAKQRLDKCYSNSATTETMAKRWYADFKCRCTDTNNVECSGRSNSAVVPENTKKHYKLVLANHKLKLREITGVEEIRWQCVHHFDKIFLIFKSNF